MFIIALFLIIILSVPLILLIAANHLSLFRKNEIINYNYNENAINYYKQQNNPVIYTKREYNEDNTENYSNIYKPKIYLITLNELVFHNVLLDIAKELDLILCSQVSLYNIIETKKRIR